MSKTNRFFLFIHSQTITEMYHTFRCAVEKYYKWHTHITRNGQSDGWHFWHANVCSNNICLMHVISETRRKCCGLKARMRSQSKGNEQRARNDKKNQEPRSEKTEKKRTTKKSMCTRVAIKSAVSSEWFRILIIEHMACILISSCRWSHSINRQNVIQPLLDKMHHHNDDNGQIAAFVRCNFRIFPVAHRIYSQEKEHLLSHVRCAILLCMYNVVYSFATQWNVQRMDCDSVLALYRRVFLCRMVSARFELLRIF